MKNLFIVNSIVTGELRLMMNYIFAGLVIIAAIWGVCSGNSSEVATAVLESGSGTVNLMLTVVGAMSLWNGIMAIAEKSKLTEYATGLLRPVIRLIMPNLKKGGDAEKYVCMNVVSNLLGLGNAATPLGLKAMSAMSREHGDLRGRASPEMMTFVVINTASLQLLPTMLLTIRSEAGSSDPMGIIPCVWMTSVVALTAGLLMCFILGVPQKLVRKERRTRGKYGKLHRNNLSGGDSAVWVD